MNDLLIAATLASFLAWLAWPALRAVFFIAQAVVMFGAAVGGS